MKRFLQAVASQCFITGLMQRLLFLQLWDHLPPLYLVLSPIYPRPPIPSNESRGTNGWVDHIVPLPSVGYRLCSPWIPAREKWVLVRAEMSAWTPTHYCFTKESQWVQGLFIRGLRYIFAPGGGRFLLVPTWCSGRMYTRQKEVFTTLQPRIWISKALADGLLTTEDQFNIAYSPASTFKAHWHIITWKPRCKNNCDFTRVYQWSHCTRSRK